MRFWIIRDERQIPVELEERPEGYTAVLDGVTYEVGCARILDGLYSLLMEGESYEVAVHSHEPGSYDVHMYDGVRHVDLLSPLDLVLRSQHGGPGARGGSVRAPMPGKVVKVLVEEGQSVLKGQGLVVVEAMKMQNELQATADAVVQHVRVREGDSVESGAELVTFGGAQEGD